MLSLLISIAVPTEKTSPTLLPTGIRISIWTIIAITGVFLSASTTPQMNIDAPIFYATGESVQKIPSDACNRVTTEIKSFNIGNGSPSLRLSTLKIYDVPEPTRIQITAPDRATMLVI